MIVKLTRENLRKIPSSTGVYIFEDAKSKPIYIGKAANLKARIASHFENAKKDLKEAAIFENATRIKMIETPTEFKALLLEAQLIKRHQPRFNKIWKDDKSYLYIWITREEYPKILLARAREASANPKGLFFGPFQGTRTAEEVIREIRKVIPFCTRKRISRGACFHSKIGLCNPCPNEISKIKDKKLKTRTRRQYLKNISRVKKILEGKTKPVITDLYRKIKKLSRDEQYEGALALRNRVFRFERYLAEAAREVPGSRTAIDNPARALLDLLLPFYPNLRRLRRIEAYDVSNIGGKHATAAMVVATIGVLDKNQYRKFRIKTSGPNDLAMHAEALKRRFGNDWPKPDIIAIDGGKPQVKAALDVLAEIERAIPVIGIAKAPDRLVIGTGKLPTLRPKTNDPGFNLIRLLRDESHRFSRKYHLHLRNKEFLHLQ